MSSNDSHTTAAILWDFGGVFTSSPFEAFNILEERLGTPKDFIRQTNAINPEHNAWAQFESNSVSLDEFDALFAAESEARGHRIPGKEVIAVLSGQLRPRMVACLRCAKPNIKWPASRTMLRRRRPRDGAGPGQGQRSSSGDVAL